MIKQGVGEHKQPTFKKLEVPGGREVPKYPWNRNSERVGGGRRKKLSWWGGGGHFLELHKPEERLLAISVFQLPLLFHGVPFHSPSVPTF